MKQSEKGTSLITHAACDDAEGQRRSLILKGHKPKCLGSSRVKIMGQKQKSRDKTASHQSSSSDRSGLTHELTPKQSPPDAVSVEPLLASS